VFSAVSPRASAYDSPSVARALLQPRCYQILITPSYDPSVVKATPRYRIRPAVAGVLFVGVKRTQDPAGREPPNALRTVWTDRYRSGAGAHPSQQPEAPARVTSGPDVRRGGTGNAGRQVPLASASGYSGCVARLTRTPPGNGSPVHWPLSVCELAVPEAPRDLGRGGSPREVGTDVRPA
jgi:hypothetical protein